MHLATDVNCEVVALTLDIVSRTFKRDRKRIILKLCAVVEIAKCVVCESVKFDLHVSYSMLLTL